MSDPLKTADRQPPVSDPAVIDWWRLMRKEQPVHRDPVTGAWMVYRYADVAKVLRDPATFSSDWSKMLPGVLNARQLDTTDPPRHRALRGVLGTEFTGRAVGRLESRITRIAGELLDTLTTDGRADLVADILYPFPIMVTLELLGLPAEDHGRFHAWVESLLSLDPEAGQKFYETKAVSGGMEILDYLHGHLTARRADPRDDLLTRLTTLDIDGQPLSDDDITSFARLLFSAGLFSTTMVMSHTVRLLCEHPATMAEIRKDMGLLPKVTEEVLRYQPTLASLHRMTTTDVTLAGQRIPARQLVTVWLGSANRDESHFTDPDVFDIHRRPNAHLAFGLGIHYCIGAALSRLETRVMLEQLLTRYPELRPDPGREVVYYTNPLVAALKQFPVVVEAH
ncbi:cytochrome P450 [Streptomyces sp. 6N223]|uniref:cytochrome P450 n=1 Tax=Streptomyces sp. 6N223 TaxID=3457412 RepID=UPI003FD15872